MAVASEMLMPAVSDSAMSKGQLVLAPASVESPGRLAPEAPELPADESGHFGRNDAGDEALLSPSLRPLAMSFAGSATGLPGESVLDEGLVDLLDAPQLKPWL